MSQKLIMALFLSAFFSYPKAEAQDLTEPAYCEPEAFRAHEVTAELPGIQRAHIYNFGQMNLVGLAVGDSDPAAVQALAERFSDVKSDEKFCTWYLNDGNPAAAEAFVHRPLSNPAFSPAEALVAEYSAALDGSFDAEAVNFVSCAQKHHYLALGCDGMKHRGPSVFAMLLSFSGCSPAHSVELVEQVWGKNFIASSKRLALAQKAYEMGSARPDSRRALQAALGQ